ncbi:hypothetical protein A2V68_02850 [candidate division Kazan bacterium RBG_13_50_9]|uniref:Aminotransferase class IV n=1 Tax=candidate division Kazan bacterium RBG_13_50_9 TaxID=1798535 RepID=A0A1F4NSQ3_UNCK3|nr:MAG: hypothetical protein A2V68_02850 [candidate division Kazan bacterium RBG_13_50_9]
MWLVHNGKILDKSEALVPIYDPALFADFRIYETLRIEGGRVVFLEDHLRRIANSAEVIELKLGCTFTAMQSWIEQCISANQTDFGIYRLIIHGDVERNQQSQVFIYPENFVQPTADEYRQGIKVVTFRGERIYPAAKTISRLTQFRAARFAKEHDAFEAILIGEDNRVHEGVRSNLFIIKDGVLITPALATVLPGIRRRYVIELARQLNIPVEERPVIYQELLAADEVFVTSTIMELAPVRRIDSRKLPANRPIYEQLSRAFKLFKQARHYEKTSTH